MPEKNIYFFACFIFIILNTLLFCLYYDTTESSAFIEYSNRSILNRLHQYVEFPRNMDIELKNVSFINIGEELVPVWRNEPTADFLSLDSFSSRYLKFAKNPCWLELFDNETESFNVSTILKSFYKSDHGKKRRKQSLKLLKFNGKLVRMRCLPYFMIIGQPKCGTTDLYFRISQHRQVIPSLVKGPHWWTRKFFGSSGTKPVPFSSYVDLFTTAADIIGSGVQENHYKIQEQIVTGEASPSTLWDTSGALYECRKIIRRNGCDTKFASPQDSEINGPCSCVNNSSWILRIPERIRSVLPNILLIVILRNPTNRLYSDFLYFDRFPNKSKELFHQKVKEAIHVFQTCVRRATAMSCAYSEELRNQMEVRLHIGLYVIYLENWMKVFKMKQFHLIRFEDYVSAPNHALKQVFKFLKLRNLSILEEEMIWSSTPLNRNPLVKRYGAMFPDTRRLLDKFYSPYNHKLSNLLNDSKFLWEKVPVPTETELDWWNIWETPTAPTDF